MKALFLISFLIPFCFYSQNKKITYLNETYNEVSESEFLKGKYSIEFLDLYFETDSTIQGLLVRRKNIGRLNKNEFDSLKENLNINELKKNELIIVIYYPGKDNCNGIERNSTWNIFDEDYLKKLKRISRTNHHWIYKSDENLKYYYPSKIDWKKDKDAFIENMFFKYHYPCSSLVVVNSKGNFITFFGEFGKQTVWEVSKQIKR